jgi:large subunit ribosomal protein L14
MILPGSFLTVSDNSGAKKVKCIHLVEGGKYASVGDRILVSVQQVKHTGKVKKGDVLQALVTETRKPVRRSDGSIFSSSRNASILLTSQGLPIGSRLGGLVSYELRKKNSVKILSLATYIM